MRMDGSKLKEGEKRKTGKEREKKKGKGKKDKTEKRGKKEMRGKNERKGMKEKRTQEEKIVHSSSEEVVCSTKKHVAIITTAENMAFKKDQKMKEEERLAMEICLTPQGDLPSGKLALEMEY